ncbi:MAG: hypothetical protein ABIP61_11305, partial [Burkholderiaceae bacterium]
MTSPAQDIIFVVAGQLEDPAAAPRPVSRGTSRASVRVGVQRSIDEGGGAQQRAGEGTLRESAGDTLRESAGDTLRVRARPGEDVVVLTLANGPTLVLHPEDARDLMRAQAGAGPRVATPPGASGASSASGPAGAVRAAKAAAATGAAGTSSTGRGPAAAEGEVAVPAQFGWPALEGAATRGTSRGWMGQVVLSAFDVITNLAKDPAVTLATALITKKVDGQVDAGVYELTPEALPASLKGSGRKRDALPSAPDGGPLLVLVHGTFVDTVSTFGKLWALHPQSVRALFTHYAGRV